jgi:sulfate/thiosulfate transport system permease protein
MAPLELEPTTPGKAPVDLDKAGAVEAAPADATVPEPRVPSPPTHRPPGRARRPFPFGTAGGGLLTVLYLSVIVLVPLGATVWSAFGSGHGWSGFWHSVTTPDAWSALKLTIVASLIVAVVNLVMGTLIAWVLVRDNFPGKRIVDVIIDLPFALPTIVAGLTLLALYGPNSNLGVDIAYKQSGVVVALLFVTLPYVIRTVQPVMIELDQEMEEGAASLGASRFTIFRRIILPNLLPAMLSGTALAFARSMSEFGSTVLISGNLPGHTQVAAVQIYGQIESDNRAGAAAVSTILLVVALVVLLALDLIQRWSARRG